MEGFQVPVVQWPLPAVLAYFFIGVALWSLLGRLYPVLRFLCKYRCQRPLINRCGRGSWAVVTGASYGIGLGFAQALATRGFNLVLIARSEHTLKKLAGQLEAYYRIYTRVIVFDFTNAGSDYEGFYESLTRQVGDLDVSFVVNNVGWGVDSFFEKLDLAAVTKMLELNIWPGLVLSRWALTCMEKRASSSVILNLSSAASLLPVPTAALYSATKKYIDFLSHSLSNEKCLHNVHIMSLRPGFVMTPMVESNKLTEEMLMISVEECAEAALEHVGTAPYTMGHWKHRLLRGLTLMLPEKVMAIVPLKRLRSVSRQLP